MDTAPYELVLTRIIDASPAEVFHIWTTRLPEWWGPHGMTTPVCEMDLRPGGIFKTVMRTADGTEYPGCGVFLEVIQNEKIVSTDGYLPGWIPAEHFMTAVTTFEEFEGKTRYTSRALHKSAEDMKKHEAMGFHEGWGQSVDRLVAVVARTKQSSNF